MKIPNWNKIVSDKTSDHKHRWKHENQDIVIGVDHIKRGRWRIIVNGVKINHRSTYGEARSWAMNKMMNSTLLEIDD